MATIASDSSEAHDAPRPPISLHPAFPAIVALWFAALLGIGSLVLPVALVERLVSLAGFGDPPLGFLERGVVALVAAGAGAAAGLAIARRVARGHDRRPSRAAKFAAGARRPISVAEELGGERVVNGHALPVTRRRALAIAEDERPSDFLYMAPLPGHDQADTEAPYATDVPPAEPEPLELCDTLAELPEIDEPAAYEAPDMPLPDEDEPMTFKQEFQPSPPTMAFGRKVEQAPAEDERHADPEPLPFAAPSLSRRALQADDEPESAEQPVEAVDAPAPEFDAQDDEGPGAPADWAEAPVDDLGMVQLVQRLGASLERRREWAARQAVTVPAPAPVLVAPADFEAAAAEEAAQAMAAYFAQPAPVEDSGPGGDSAPVEDSGPVGDSAVEPEPAREPAVTALHPGLLNGWRGEEDEDEEFDSVPSFTLPLRNAVVPTIAFDEPGQTLAADGDEDGDDDDGYSSLLAMRNPFTVKENAFVRIDEPDQGEIDEIHTEVVFPGQSSSIDTAEVEPAGRPFDPPGTGTARATLGPQPADADAALRAALATLQRMSGTA